MEKYIDIRLFIFIFWGLLYFLDFGINLQNLISLIRIRFNEIYEINEYSVNEVS